MRRLFSNAAVGGALWLVGSHGAAYEVATHRQLTDWAYARTVTLNGPLFTQLGIDESPASKLFPGSYGFSKEARLLLLDGSQYEDEPPKFLNHFFNPLTGQGLGVSQPSPNWGLDDVQILAGQGYSYRNARESYYDALTKSRAEARDVSFGQTFEALGHVMHLVQDMAQPQHVRNDIHPTPSNDYSRYERFTNQVEIRGFLPNDGYPNTYATSETRSLKSPRAFWSTGSTSLQGVASGKGMAEFANRNFVSAGTNFGGTTTNLVAYSGGKGVFPLPDPALAIISAPVDAHDLYSPLSPGLPANSFMTFIGTPMVDTLFPEYLSDPSAMTSTFSLFDQDLQNANKGLVFALNQFNFIAAQRYLIPRAVAYSAGLVDFFFRGDINLAIEQAHMGKYVIQNFSTEPMRGKFELYYDALDGDRKPVPGASWSDLSISAKDMQGNPGVSAGIQLGAPTDAKTSGKYMLVFSGDLGEEKKGDQSSDYSFGAVIGRMVDAVPIEGLYILGEDAQGQKMTFRVDESGTHLLNGRDPQGVLHHAAFDPVGTSTIGKKASYVKQARFLAGGYRIQALSAPGGRFVRDPNTQEIVTSQHQDWVAQSTDPSVGWFSFTIAATGPNAGSMPYVRTYTDAQGRTQTASGSLLLPPLPDYSTSLPSVNYQDFVNSKLIVSGDGLHVHGLMTTTVTINGENANPSISTETRHHLRLDISLAATAVVTVVEDASLATVTTRETTWTDSGITAYLDVTACSCGLIPAARAQVTLRTQHASGTDRQWVGVFNNALTTFDITEEMNYHNQESSNYTQTISGGENCQYITSYIYNDTVDEAGRSTVTYGLLDGPVTSLVWNQSRPVVTRHTIPNPCLGYLGGTPPEVGICLGGAPVDGDCILDPAGPALVSTSDRRSPAFVMTAAGNGIVFLTDNLGEGTHYIFRGADLGAKQFVGDASPLGEIFFATTDMTMIVHEPASGRMPVFVPPSNLIKILSALWL